MDPSKQDHLSNPLTPNSVPKTVIVDSDNQVINRSIENPLDFTPTSGFMWFIKLPSIVFFGMLTAYLIGRYKFNIIFLIILAHIVYFIFKRRVKKYALSLDVLAKEKNRKDALGEFETVEWLNYIVSKFWEVSEAAVSAQIYSEVNNVLIKNTPKFLKSIKLTELTLGTRPPIVEKIGFLSSNEDTILIEFAANFIPLQTSEDILAYFGGERKHWNTCIELTATIGFVKLPILVRNFTFSGIFRAEISLTRKIPFIKQVSVCMLELPLIDFELQPLKTVDFMDIPYLSKFIRTVMNTVLASQVVSPKSITVNLENIATYRGKIIGVVYVYVKALETTEETQSCIELRNNGLSFGKTALRAGRDPIFNEGFYEIIYDTTKHISITANTSGKVLSGKIFMRNLNKHRYSEKVHISDNDSRLFVDLSTHFFKITERNTESAIVDIILMSIKDLQRKEDPKNKLYSTYCIMSVETKETLKARQVIKKYETKRIFATKDPFFFETVKLFVKNFNDYIIKIAVMNEKDDSEIGSVFIPMIDAVDNITSFYKISGVLSGDVEVKFGISYIDLEGIDESIIETEINKVENNQISTDVSSAQELETVTESLISEDAKDNVESKDNTELSITRNRNRSVKEKSLSDISMPGNFKVKKRKPKKSKRKSDEKKPKIPGLNIGIYNMARPKNEFVDYKRIYRFEVKEILKEGLYYIVFETDHLNVKMEPFTTELKMDRHAFVPIADEKYIKARLFGISSNGDILISEEILNLKDTVVVFDKVKVEFNVETEDLTYIGVDDVEGLKVVQFKIDKISKPGVYTLDILTDTVIISEKIHNSVQTVMIGSEPIQCILRDNNKLVSRFVVPIRRADEIFKLNSSGLECSIKTEIQACKMQKQQIFSRGSLELHIIKGTNLSQKDGSPFIPVIKVYLNGDKVFKTEKRSKGINPMFNESLKLKVDKSSDNIALYISDYGTISTNSVIFFKEFSLFNLNEGYSKHEIRLNDGENNELTDSYLQVIFNFSKENENVGDVENFE